MARSSECTEQYAQKVFDSAGIVRDACLHQLTIRSTTRRFLLPHAAAASLYVIRANRCERQTAVAMRTAT
jgi:hypothetical protein